jgi:PAS domain-containing protein
MERLKSARRKSGAWSIPTSWGVFIWDFDGRILEANDEFLRMVSYDREDLISGRIR